VVCVKDLADELAAACVDAPGSASVNTELKVLERAGLLSRGPRERGERRVYLLRQEGGYWGTCRELRVTKHANGAVVARSEVVDWLQDAACSRRRTALPLSSTWLDRRGAADRNGWPRRSRAAGPSPMAIGSRGGSLRITACCRYS
jgi:hypothetical protein